MSTNLTPSNSNGHTADSPGGATTVATTQARAEHALHVKAIPVAIWERARHNAITSRLPFRTYIIRVLEDCQPYPLATLDNREGSK